MKADFRISLRTLLFVTLSGSLALTACGNPVETLPPDENAGAGGTAPQAGSGGSSGTVTGGTSGSTATGGASGSTATGGTSGSTATGGTAGSATGGSAGATGGSATGGAGNGGISGAAGSSAGTAGTGSVTPVTWQEASLAIAGSCAKTMCHNGSQDPPLLAIPAQTQYMALTSTYTVSTCGTATKLVVPNDVANSAILKLVNGECSLDGEPFLMPGDCATAPCLPAAQIATLRNWILSGAPGPL